MAVKSEGAELKNVLTYILYKIRNIRPTIGRTRVIKLLYLSDLIARARIGKKITNIKYQYYFYGPYSKRIVEELEDFSSKKIVEDYKYRTNSGIAHDYRITDEGAKKVEAIFDDIPEEQKKIIDEVVKKYGNIRLDKLLDVVYSTKPMKEHSPGDALL